MEIALLIVGFLGVLAYFIGSIPTGAWFAWWKCGINIQQHGSGNIGASNVARVLGQVFFIPIFLVDALKAWAILVFGAMIVPAIYLQLFIYVASAALLLGNAFSMFLKFRGGKGVATVIGIMLYVLPSFVGLFVVSWLALLKMFRQPFIASLGAIMLTSGILGLWYPSQVPFLLCIVVWLMVMHSNNVKKMWFV